MDPALRLLATQIPRDRRIRIEDTDLTGERKEVITVKKYTLLFRRHRNNTRVFRDGENPHLVSYL